MKSNNPALIYQGLQRTIIICALLNMGEYVEMISLHLLLFEYHLTFEHPHTQLFCATPASFVGEDIELGNRMLSHYATSTSRATDYRLLNDAYKQVGLLLKSGMQFSEELSEFKDLVKGKRRYELTDEKALEKAQQFFTDTILALGNNNFQHYVIPRKWQKDSSLIPPDDVLSMRNREGKFRVLLTKDLKSKGRDTSKRTTQCALYWCHQLVVHYSKKDGGTIHKTLESFYHDSTSDFGVLTT
jgi:hypothetical protein